MAAETNEVLAQLKDSGFKMPERHGDPTLDPQTDTERTVIALVKGGSVDDKLKFLLSQSLEAERMSQRDDDINRDHGIRLMARQKKQPMGRICFVFWSLVLIYTLQLIVLYNLGRFSKNVDTDTITEWMERKQWHNPTLIPNYTVQSLPDQVRTVLNRSSVDYSLLDDLGFCMTPTGVFEVVFNVGSGLFLIYLFIFSDVFFVIVNMPLARSFPDMEGLKGLMMICCNLVMVAANSAVLAWLGVIAGQMVNSNCGSFAQVLNASLSVFIVLQIDDEVLPFIRFWAEERGHMDEMGNLSGEQLDVLTHGNQYYKPGYAHRITRRAQESMLLRVVAAVLSVVTLAIVAIPAAVTVAEAAQSFKQC